MELGKVSNPANDELYFVVVGIHQMRETHNSISLAYLLCVSLKLVWTIYNDRTIYRLFSFKAAKMTTRLGNNVPHSLPVLKNASMSPASFVVSSAPSPELMAASTRSPSSLPPKWMIPPKNDKKMAHGLSRPGKKRHGSHTDGCGDW